MPDYDQSLLFGEVGKKKSAKKLLMLARCPGLLELGARKVLTPRVPSGTLTPISHFARSSLFISLTRSTDLAVKEGMRVVYKYSKRIVLTFIIYKGILYCFCGLFL